LIRDTGKPRTDSASFSAHAGDTLTIVVTSPAAQGLNATVDLNETRVYASADDRSLPDTIRAIARATNSLRIWMAGKPGSTLRITVSVRVSAGPVERRALTAMFGSSVAGSLPLGRVEYPLGAVLHYSFTPNAGFERLRVVIDGVPAPDVGSLTMDRAHWIAASADTVITLDALELSLSQALRGVLSSASILEDWATYQAAVERAVAGWGVTADMHLARVERATINPASDLRNLVRLDSALVSMSDASEYPARRASQSLSAISGKEVNSTRARNVSSVSDDREPVQALLVNGILTSRSGFREDFGLFSDLLRLDAAQRFPVASVALRNVYNPSIQSLDSLSALAALCAREAGLENAYRIPREMSEYGARYLICVAGHVASGNDLTEMFRWARDAVGTVDPNSIEVNRLADVIWRYRTAFGRHVLIVGHSEGSLMTQLAIQKLKVQAGFDEDTAVRCVGTVSVAGVGTSNWPLSDRHARFVVAKWDLVTLLPGILKNARPVVEDAATRSIDSAYAALVANGRPIEVMLPMGTYDPIDIHHLSRYLQSEVTGPLIKDNLDALYRTCAVGAVTVTPASATVQLFGAYPFRATWSALDGLPLQTADSVSWSVDSAFATVTPVGRLLAGDNPGVVSLQALVRKQAGSATVTIVDDSIQATYIAPTVDVTERIGVFGPYPPGETTCDAQFMTIHATALSGASISSVELHTRKTTADSVYYSSWSPPLDEEFMWRTSNCIADGMLRPDGTDNWYRLVVTDSHGKSTEIIGPRP
jgi:hypothetical protein